MVASLSFRSTAFFALLCAAVPARAQCLEWDDSFHPPGADRQVVASAVFDDGTGPALYIGGIFAAVANQNASAVAKWNGSSWSPLGSGVFSPVSTDVRALAVFDDGSGDALYVGGEFSSAGGVPANHIAKWNGSSWSALGVGVNQLVRALAVFDDGSGPVLYAGGDFTTAGGVSASRIAKWNGSSWSALGSDVESSVSALAVYDDGSGSALFAGGSFVSAGGWTTPRIAKWNGTSWSPLGTGITGPEVVALAAYDDGTGAALYAGGQFSSAGGTAANHIARWNGSTWSSVGNGMNDQVWTLAVHDDGSGSSLFAGGEFTTAGGGAAARIARWDGASWSSLGDGVDGTVRTLAVLDDGSGPELRVGGNFGAADATVRVNGVATWDGSTWSTIGGCGHGVGHAALALCVFDDGDGAALYAGGYFSTAGCAAASSIARWDGAAWSPLGSGLDGSQPTVYVLAVFDDGGSPALYAGGYFTAAGGIAANHIAKWNGSSWSTLGAGTDSSVFALAAACSRREPRTPTRCS